MKQKTITLLLFAALLARCATAQPRIFAEGIISTGDYETHPAFSPTGDTLYFLKGLPDAGFFSICVSYKKEGKWTTPQVAPFSGQYTDADPFVTRDGKTLYFVSNRPPKEGAPARSDWDIWKVEITASGWGKPIHLDSTINSSSSEYFPTLADNGNLYFGSGRKGGRGRSDIYVSRLVDGRYTEPENLGDSINTPDNEYEPYIAPDESYLIFMATYPNGIPNADFYISRRVNGSWTKAVKLPEPINSSATEWGGKVTRDGKYFFFGSSRNKINDTLPQREDIKAFDHRLHSAGNGLGDIYYVDMKTLTPTGRLAGQSNTKEDPAHPSAPFHQRITGNPLDHLPPNITVLTSFGERADFSPDNTRVAFMTKSFGDAMVIDLKTHKITCLTCRIPAAAFLRVMHLVSGDYILIGPEKFEDIHISRTRDNEGWFLSKQPGSKPVKFGLKMSEGMAISKTGMKIAFSQTHEQIAEIPEGASRLIVADVDTSGTPKIIHQKIVYESPDRDCTIEAQDFFDNDSKMTFTCYEPGGLASVMTLDLKTGMVANNSRAPGTYNECEGIFPGGKYTCVEGDRQCDLLGGKRGSGNIDIWKLKLDGSGKDFVRMTHFNDYEGGKASNPVISTDGKYMCFQLANTSDPAGVGYGLLLYDLSP